MTTFKPTEGKNTNCMEGRVCPKCGNEDKLWVRATIILEMTDDGTSDAYADHEYDGDAPTECPKCGFKAPLSVFDGQPAPIPPTGAANQTRLALDDETCPKCGKLHDFCRHCKKVRVSCGDSDHEPFALCDKCDIELNGKYEPWEK